MNTVGGIITLLIGAGLIAWGIKRGKRKVLWYVIGGLVAVGGLGQFAPASTSVAPHALTHAQKVRLAAQDLRARRQAFLAWWRPLDADVHKADAFYDPVSADLKAYIAHPSDAQGVQFYQDAQQADANLLSVDASTVNVPSEFAYVQTSTENYISSEWAVAHELPSDINNHFTIAETAHLKTDLQAQQSAQSDLMLSAVKASQGLGLSLTQLFR